MGRPANMLGMRRHVCVWALVPLLVSACGDKKPPPAAPESGGAAPAADGTPADDADAGGDDLAGDDGAAADDDVASDDTPAPEDDVVRKAVLKLTLKRSGKTLEHPGYVVELDEWVTIVMTQGKRTHEVDFVYAQGEGEGYDVEVVYRDNGKKVLEDKQVATLGEWLELKSGKTSLELFIDPDAKRVDNVELGEGDNPLDGMGGQ